MYQKVKAYVKEHYMLKEQDKVVVGVSGGADSVCLLFMLAQMQKELLFSIIAVHVHHGIRGENADRDEMFVKKMCNNLGVECICFHEDVRAYAKDFGYTEEEAGRNIRRKCFQHVFNERNCTKIALAHHKNDNVETFLWNLCRGTAFKGMGGILPVAGNYIRPLLCLGKKEIESYLKKENIDYCLDETNLTDDYTRNRIRNHVIPYLEESVNTQTVEHIAETIENIRLFNEYIEKEVEKYVKCCVFQKDGKWIVKKVEYEKIPVAFRKNLLHKVIAMAADGRKDIESVHIKMLEDLLNRQVGKRCDLPYQLLAVRTYAGIEVGKCVEVEEALKPDVQIRVFEKTPEMVTFPEKAYTKWFDYDIIKCTVEIRHRKSGDYIVIDKSGKTQKLKQYFVNEKIPQNMRDQIWLLADGQEIMWIVGYRQSQAYQITENTTKIMEISFAGKDMME